jgi:hypothetical protein
MNIFSIFVYSLQITENTPCFTVIGREAICCVSGNPDLTKYVGKSTDKLLDANAETGVVECQTTL